MLSWQKLIKLCNLISRIWRHLSKVLYILVEVLNRLEEHSACDLWSWCLASPLLEVAGVNNIVITSDQSLLTSQWDVSIIKSNLCGCKFRELCDRIALLKCPMWLCSKKKRHRHWMSLIRLRLRANAAYEHAEICKWAARGLLRLGNAGRHENFSSRFCSVKSRQFWKLVLSS